ncbi:MAG TPA: hypothetical protein VK302_10600 [Terriglobales bacterium]|nr:hypothetical protein [Terriglobales bacterium]
MPTMTLTATSSLQSRIHEAQAKIVEAEQSLDATVHELSGVEDLLCQLQNERTQECIAVAEGRTRADPSAFDKRIAAAKDKIVGLEDVKRRKEIALVDCRVALHDLNEKLHRIETEAAIRNEGFELDGLIERTRDHIETRNTSEQKIQLALTALRGKKYLSEQHRRRAFDAAQALQRNSLGMRA